jgi:FkbM family methyltransferase
MTFLSSSQPVFDSTVKILRPLQIRGKVRLLDKIVPKTGERSARIFGCRIKLDLSDHIQRWIYFGGYERQETRWVRNWLRPGMTVADVGANVGYYTLLAASCVGARGRVFAVEPSPYAYNRLRATVAANGLSQVVALQAGLGSAGGEGLLYLPPAGNHSPSMVRCDRQDSVKVALRTLDDCLAEWRVDRLDLLKMDVEGFEPQILAGARSALSTGRIRAILCELNDWWLRQMGGSAEMLFRQITSQGFSGVFGPRQFSANRLYSCFFVHRSAAGAPGAPPHSHEFNDPSRIGLALILLTTYERASDGPHKYERNLAYKRNLGRPGLGPAGAE